MRGLGTESDARVQGRSRRSRQAGLDAPRRARLTWAAARADVGGSPARDREAQELASGSQRQDRRSKAKEESSRRASAPCTSAEANRRDNVVDVGEVGVR